MRRPVPGMTIESQPQEVLLRLVLWGEARGESSLGKLAVLWVIRNRAAKTGKSISDVILAPLQFSSFNANDPNRAQMLDAWRHDAATWTAIDALCELAETWPALPDPTKGADHYYVANMLNPPKWGRGSKDWNETTMIGRHVFGICP